MNTQKVRELQAYGAELFRQGKRPSDGRYKATAIQYRYVVLGWRMAQLRQPAEAQQPQEAA